MGMVVDTRIIEIVVALAVGSGATWFVARRSLSREFDQKLRRMSETFRKQHEAVVDKLNASHALARRELEHQRQTAPRNGAAAANDQRAAVARLEDQLKSAYSELDRLRLEVKGPAPEGSPKPHNGFADTQPFEPRKSLQR
ncbi:MAG: hypothetical protein AD742_17915 [Methylibium sp. NZG]|nr:MAG: hypothetical protein AD742_17915 [Methylibium sp. NZG]